MTSTEPKRRTPPIGLIGIAIMLAAIAGAVLVATHLDGGSAEPTRPAVATSQVSIRLTAARPVDITIDGKRAGTTPLTILRRRSDHPFVIGTSSRAMPMREIVPDHDQVIDVSGP